MRRAVFGARSSSARIADPVRSRARSSSTWPRKTSATMTAGRLEIDRHRIRHARGTGAGRGPETGWPRRCRDSAADADRDQSPHVRAAVDEGFPAAMEKGMAAHSTTGVASANSSQTAGRLAEPFAHRQAEHRPHGDQQQRHRQDALTQKPAREVDEFRVGTLRRLSARPSVPAPCRRSGRSRACRARSRDASGRYIACPFGIGSDAGRSPRYLAGSASNLPLQPPSRNRSPCPSCRVKWLAVARSTLMPHTGSVAVRNSSGWQTCPGTMRCKNGMCDHRGRCAASQPADQQSSRRPGRAQPPRPALLYASRSRNRRRCERGDYGHDRSWRDLRLADRAIDAPSGHWRVKRNLSVCPSTCWKLDSQ
jgi:hypothetical protein